MNISTITDEQGQPWWIAKEICNCLDINNARQAVSRLDDDEKATVILNDTGAGGRDKRIIVNEPGMYTLVLSSKKLIARVFKRWVTHEVLTSIRKTGGCAGMLVVSRGALRDGGSYD